MINRDADCFDLDVIDVAAPCHANWADMNGDDTVRHCAQCDKNVYNISELTADQARQLVLSKEGQLCVRFFRRADGTVLTQDCPIGVRFLHRRILRATIGVAAMICALVVAPLFAASSHLRRRTFGDAEGPFARIRAWASMKPAAKPIGKPVGQSWQGNVMVMGEIAAPPAAVPSPAAASPNTCPEEVE